MIEKTADKTTHPQRAIQEATEQPKPTTEEADEETGASPGTAQACNDLGLNSLAANLDRFGIKAPGQS